MFATWFEANSAEMSERLHHANKATILQEGSPANARERARGWAGVAWGPYGGFLRALQRGLARGGAIDCPVWAFAYDWRQRNATTAELLQAFCEHVLSAAKAEQVILVTHSMGGIVARAALAKKGAFKQKVAGVVHIAQPVLGAPVAYRRFLAGTSRKIDGWTMRYLLGREPADTANIFSALPGAMELLPHDGRTTPTEPAHRKWLVLRRAGADDAHTRFPGLWTLDLYTHDFHPPHLVPETSAVRRQIVDLARNAHRFHREIKVQFHKPTRSVFGTGVMTDSRVVLDMGEKGIVECAVNIEAGRDREGDGTVPAYSGEALFPAERHPADGPIDPELQGQWSIGGVEHDAICKSSKVQEIVIATIRAMMNPPTMARGSVKSEGLAAFKRMAEALAGDRSAEIELRVAKLLAQEGHDVVVLGNPDTLQTPDLTADGGWVEVKLAEGDRESIEGRVRHAFDQIGSSGTVVLVRGKFAKEETSTYEDAAAAALVDRFATQPFPVRVRVIQEAALPPLQFLQESPS